jgi:hypothetical protein
MGKKGTHTLERFVIVAIVHVLCNGQQTKGGLAPSSSRFRIARVATYRKRSGRGRSNGGKKFVPNPEITAKHPIFQLFKTM